MEIFSASGSKMLDSETINTIGIPSIVLMENAAEGIFNRIVHKGEKFIFFCGVGNNGGDGLAIARKLILAGKTVYIYVCGSILKASNEFNINYRILINMGIVINEVSIEQLEDVGKYIKESDVVVDAIMGVGLNRGIEGDLYSIIQAINKYSKHTISIDIPTGLDCNLGKELNIAVRAKETFTIEVMKKGFFSLDAKKFLGNVYIVPIGIPKAIKEKYTENIFLLSRDDYKKILPVRNLYGHKGNYGKVLILAGSKGMTGAAYITTESVVRSGAGLVNLLVEEEIQGILANKLIEAMTITYNEEEKIDRLIRDVDVIICGPGLSKRDNNRKMLIRCIKNSKCPMVMDADALNIISEESELLSYIEGRAIFTPHPGEMSRLVKQTIKEVEENRIDVCKKYSGENNIITVLKGYNTVISNGSSVVINETGSSKIASGGMGDCLTGIVGGLVAQGINLYDSAKLGVYIHGLIGDELGKDRYCVNARDIIEELPKALENILKN
ncbi:MAG: NAD(P)H-hydrate dehydratase [Clostridium sp.]|nr:NAD(P)H-hydrate dehydratase [Clostridium sp.]